MRFDRRWLRAAGLCLVLCAARPAGAAEGGAPDAGRLEPGILPALTFGSDSGLGVGALVSLVKLVPDQQPYAWRLEALASVTLKLMPDGRIETPYHEDYVSLDVPGLWGNRLRVGATLGFQRESTLSYFGAGNASVVDPARLDANPHAYEVDKISPFARTSMRARLAQRPSGRLDLFVGSAFGWNWINLYPDSQLARDLEALAPGAPQRPRGASMHGLATAVAGLLWDARDHESAPTRGTMTELSVRVGKGAVEDFQYGGVTLDQRAFFPLLGPYLVLGGRLMADVLVGDVPFYELPRSGGLVPWNAGGGARALRGIPHGRFSGKVKLLANVELRSTFFSFGLLGQRFRVGAVAFLDAGRYFADLGIDPVRDGTSIAIKVGTGGGLRLHWGEHFVIRFDAGYSPTEGTRAFYVGVRHVF